MLRLGSSSQLIGGESERCVEAIEEPEAAGLVGVLSPVEYALPRNKASRGLCLCHGDSC